MKTQNRTAQFQHNTVVRFATTMSLMVGVGQRATGGREGREREGQSFYSTFK